MRQAEDRAALLVCLDMAQGVARVFGEGGRVGAGARQAVDHFRQELEELDTSTTGGSMYTVRLNGVEQLEGVGRQGDQWQGYGYEYDADASIEAGGADCAECGGTDEHDEGCMWAGEPVQDPDDPAGMFNGAGVKVRATDHGPEVQVWISVGDPRGAFCMTLRRGRDGELRLEVPHPEDSTPHMGLDRLGSPGFYRVLSYDPERHGPGRGERSRERDALREIIEAAPDERPEYEDWGGDTERAERWGQRVGIWEAAQVAREALGLD